MQDAEVQPSLVVVYFGGNDSMAPHPSGLGPHVPLPEYVDNMKKIALHLQVIYLTVITHSYSFSRLSSLKKAFQSGNNIILLSSNRLCFCFHQSLSDSTRIIFLSCPPVDEAKVRQNQR